MHFCAIIIKRKEISVEEARGIVGDFLVAKGKSDWYSKNDYRERTFEGEQTVSLEKFRDIYKKWCDKNDMTWEFCVVDKEHDIGPYFEEESFWNFYREEEYEELITLYNKLYYRKTQELVHKLDASLYDVTLLDYHN
jgi:hypothetical protein